LTIAAEKQTYERLGLVGPKLPWKEREDTHIIRITLASEVPASKDTKSQLWHPLGPKQKSLLEAWDERRGPWDIIYHVEDPLHVGPSTREVQPQVQIVTDVKIPAATSIRACPSGTDEAEDWEEEVSNLFEWVGMACLGSERLKGYDSADPYLGVYTLDVPYTVGGVTHIKWRGLLPPKFIKQIIEISAAASFIGVVVHGVPTSPVGYLSLSSQQSPSRVPREESEDTWSLIISKQSDVDEVRWIMAESVGQWDARWG